MWVAERIEINPSVMLGKPVIRGMRIPVKLIIRKLSEGATEANLLDAYPRLTREDIQAALAYAADALVHETMVLQTLIEVSAPCVFWRMKAAISPRCNYYVINLVKAERAKPPASIAQVALLRCPRRAPWGFRSSSSG